MNNLVYFTALAWTLFSYSVPRPAVTRGSTFTPSTSHDEFAHGHVSTDTADSGRGSWTSCSSNSHDNFQSIQNQRGWDLGSFHHTQLDGPIVEVEPTGSWAEEDLQRSNRHSKDSLELSQSRQSWASSSSLSDTYEGNYGTIKRRVLDSSGVAQGKALDCEPSTDAVYKTVTSSTEKGLIGKLKNCLSLCFYVQYDLLFF